MSHTLVYSPVSLNRQALGDEKSVILSDTYVQSVSGLAIENSHYISSEAWTVATETVPKLSLGFRISGYSLIRK